MSSAALVGMDGSVDWLCLPRFDSPSVFAAILDQDIGGRFRIRPSGVYATAQSYVQETNILETTFGTSTGVVSVTDFMPIQDNDKDGKPDRDPANPPELHRIVRCSSGRVDMRCDYEPRHDYARAVPTFRARRGSGTAVEAQGGGQTMMLLSGVPLHESDDGVAGAFSLSQGETATFVMAYGPDRPTTLEHYRTRDKLELTQRYWKDLVAGMHYEGLWRDQVVRSFLLLHLMIYRGTGAIVAAPTTSLPETIGGSRNWDYRYSWLRDTSFTVDILYRLGDVYGADFYIQWLLEQCQLNTRRTRILYGISQWSSLEEQVLDHLRGYEDSRPVRIGNGASEHLQMDVFGEVITSIHSLLVLHGEISEEAWDLVCSLAEDVVNNWHRRDRGVWEVRGEMQHFVYSKVLVLGGAGYGRIHRRGRGAAPTLPTVVAGGLRHQVRVAGAGLERVKAGVPSTLRQRRAGRFQPGDPVLRPHPKRGPASAAERRRYRARADRRPAGLAIPPRGDGRWAGCAAGGRVHNAELLADWQPDLHRPDGQGLRLLQHYD